MPSNEVTILITGPETADPDPCRVEAGTVVVFESTLDEDYTISFPNNHSPFATNGFDVSKRGNGNTKAGPANGNKDEKFAYHAIPKSEAVTAGAADPTIIITKLTE